MPLDTQFMMDGHKLLWHLDRVLDWQAGKRIAPLHIDLGITTGCNLSCRYCYGAIQGHAGVDRFDMPRAPLFRLIRDAKAIGVRSIAFIGEGENTLNPLLPEALLLCRDIGLDASLATNGIALRREWFEPILSSVAWIRFNISAASPDSYFKIHGRSRRIFSHVLRNIETAVRLKENRGLPTTIGLQMVVIKENFADIVPLALLGRELGVDYLVVKPCSDSFDRRLSAPAEEYRSLDEVFQEAESYSGNGYVVSVKWQKLQNFGEKQYDSCHGTAFLIAISGNGRVFPCGHFFKIREEEFIMGNVIEATLRDIVQSDRYWEVQRRIESLNVHKECYYGCRPHYINEFLWQLRHPPKHMNFI